LVDPVADAGPERKCLVELFAVLDSSAVADGLVVVGADLLGELGVALGVDVAAVIGEESGSAEGETPFDIGQTPIAASARSGN